MADRLGESSLQIAGQGLIGQVAEKASNTMFQWFRVGTLLQHLHVVIRLHENHLAAFESLLYWTGDVSNIRDVRKPEPIPAEAKAYRFGGVVRSSENLHGQPADLEATIRSQRQPLHLPVEPVPEHLESAPRSIERDLVLAGELRCSANVIDVIVGKQYRIHGSRRHSDLRQPTFQFLVGEARVNQEVHGAIGNECCVATAAAGEDRDQERYGLPPIRSLKRPAFPAWI